VPLVAGILLPHLALVGKPEHITVESSFKPLVGVAISDKLFVPEGPMLIRAGLTDNEKSPIPKEKVVRAVKKPSVDVICKGKVPKGVEVEVVTVKLTRETPPGKSTKEFSSKVQEALAGRPAQLNEENVPV
jgi:hypothetical protein